MRLYLASSWKNKEALKPIREKLINEGHEVTARWIVMHGLGEGDDIEAQHDIDDIKAADALVLWGNLKSVTGGMWFEAGYARALGKPIIAVEAEANKDNIFLKLEGFIHLTSWEELLAWLDQANPKEAALV